MIRSLIAGALALGVVCPGGEVWAQDERPPVQDPLEAGLIEAEVARVEGDQAWLARGSADGVVVGQVYDVYADAEVYVFPLTGGGQPLVRAQRRVGRVVVVSAEGGQSRALVVERVVGMEVEGAQRAVLNPTAVPPNRPPVFLEPEAVEPVAWPESVALRFEVSNEDDEPVLYTWSTTGGVLAYETTLEPINRWTAPPQEGEYQVTVVATDLGGGVARSLLTVRSRGIPPGSGWTDLRATGRVFGPSSLYGRVRDVCFDSPTVVGRSYVLEMVGGGTFSSGSPRVRVELEGRRFQIGTSDREYHALAVSPPGAGRPSAFFALSRETNTVQRFEFGGPWSRVFAKPPTVLGVPDGGAGNGRFQSPVDVAVGGEGDVYVLDAGQGCVQHFTNLGEFVVSFGRPGEEAGQLQRATALAVDTSNETVYVLDDARKSVIAYRDFRQVQEFRVGQEEDRLVGLAVDPYSHHVYVLEASGGQVRRYRPDGTPQLPAYTPQAGQLGALRAPTRLRMDPLRRLWVVDREGDSVVRLDTDLNFMGRTGGLEFSGQLRVAATSAGGVVVLDRGDYKVTGFDREGWVVTRFGGEGSEPGRFEDPVDLAVSGTGDVFVLDAERVAVFAFSRGGNFLRAYGRAGLDPRELHGVIDLTTVNDRSFLAVVQQRPDNNFNLLSPTSGQSELRFGRDFTGDLTPRFGCVTGISGEGRGVPTFWTVDEDRERVFRVRMNGGLPTALEVEFEEISDIEAAVTGEVVVVDYDEERVVVLTVEGSVATTFDDLDEPWDVGLDDYGRVYVYDGATRRVVQLGP